MDDGGPLLDGRPVTLEHRASLAPFLEGRPQPLAGYTFAALLAWSEVFAYRWSFVEPDCLFLTCDPGRSGERHLLQPVGRPGPEVRARLVEAARRLPYRLRVVGVSRAFIEENQAFVDAFDVVEDRNQAQYVYRARDLADLPGRRFSGKRNLIAQAARLGWTTEPLTPAHVPECRGVVEAAWRGLMAEDRPSIAQEARAIGWVLDHLPDCGQEGLLVRMGGRAVAFSLFERQNEDTAAIHFERALRDVRGAYQVVQQETARVLAARGFTWINREEDLGDPGLRQAKRSYHPAFLESAHLLSYRG